MPTRLLVLFVLTSVMLGACASSGGQTDSRQDDTITSATRIGSSRAGRDINAVTLGRGPTRVYLIGSIHGDESEGRAALDDIRRELERTTGGATVRFLTDMNPDGSHARTRTNSAGIDLNRNWPAANFAPAKDRGRAPLSEPESAAVHADIVRFDPHFIIVLHSARGGPFVNFDGPASAKQLSDRFATAARTAGDTRWKVVPDMGYPTPGSMGSYFGVDRGIPILTVELRRGDSPSNIPAPLVAGISAVLADRSVALLPLSKARPHGAVAARPSPRLATPERAR